MAVPKKKMSPSRRNNMRRSADALAAPTYVEDKDPGELRRPHHVDLKTGMAWRPPGAQDRLEGQGLKGFPRPCGSRPASAGLFAVFGVPSTGRGAMNDLGVIISSKALQILQKKVADISII